MNVVIRKHLGGWQATIPGKGTVWSISRAVVIDGLIDFTETQLV